MLCTVAMIKDTTIARSCQGLRPFMMKKSERKVFALASPFGKAAFLRLKSQSRRLVFDSVEARRNAFSGSLSRGYVIEEAGTYALALSHQSGGHPKYVRRGPHPYQEIK